MGYRFQYLAYLGTALASWILLGVAIWSSGAGKSQPTPVGSILFATLGPTSFLVAGFSLLWFDSEDRRPRRFEPFIAWAFFAVGFAVVIPVFMGAQGASVKTVCLSNIKQIGTSLNVYLADNNDRFPPGDRWWDASKPYRKSSDYRCPLSEAPSTYAMNRRLGTFSFNVIEEPSRTVLLFEGEAQFPNASGGAEWCHARHNGGANYCFADGMVKWNKATSDKLSWSP